MMDNPSINAPQAKPSNSTLAGIGWIGMGLGFGAWTGFSNLPPHTSFLRGTVGWQIASSPAFANDFENGSFKHIYDQFHQEVHAANSVLAEKPLRTLFSRKYDSLQHQLGEALKEVPHEKLIKFHTSRENRWWVAGELAIAATCITIGAISLLKGHRVQKEIDAQSNNQVQR